MPDSMSRLESKRLFLLANPPRGGIDDPPKPSENQPAPERPKWMPEGYDAPEKFAEDFGKFKSRAETADAFEKKYGRIDDFDTRLANAEAKLRAQLEAEWSAKHPTNTQPAAQPDEPEWDSLTPAQQRKLLVEQAQGEVRKAVDQQVQQYWNEARQELTRGLGANQQQLNLLIKGFEISRKTGVPLEQVWPEVEKLATAAPDALMSMAVERLTSPAAIKKQVDEAVAAAKVAWEQEAKNKQSANFAAAQPASIRELRSARGADGKISKNSIRDAVLKKYANGELG
jgi:hypothetical protein